jgi:hypothetical protein
MDTQLTYLVAGACLPFVTAVQSAAAAAAAATVAG